MAAKAKKTRARGEARLFDPELGAVVVGEELAAEAVVAAELLDTVVSALVALALLELVVTVVLLPVVETTWEVRDDVCDVMDADPVVVEEPDEADATPPAYWNIGL